MLLLSNISDVQMHSDAWFDLRLAKFTSSEIYLLMGKDPYDSSFKRYVRRKVGEDISGIPARDPVDTEATRWGNEHEVAAIIKFGKHIGVDFLVTQKLIHAPDSRFSSTPDCLWIHKPRLENGITIGYDVYTGEIKNPITYENYIALAECESPAEVKLIKKEWYWQVLDQMQNAGALRGYLVIHHPSMKDWSMRIIEFKAIDLLSDLKLLSERKELAIVDFNKIRAKILKMKNPIFTPQKAA